MSDGKRHDWANNLLMVAAVVLGLWHLSWFWPCCWCAFGIWLGGHWLSPDLDVVSRPYRRWGWFRWVWWPYQWMVPHRSSLSHSWVGATVFRLVYVFSLLVLGYVGLRFALGANWPHPWDGFVMVSSRIGPGLLWLIGGVFLANGLHLILDSRWFQVVSGQAKPRSLR